MSRTCAFWTYKCTNAKALPIRGEYPSVGSCLACEHYVGPPRPPREQIKAQVQAPTIDPAVTEKLTIAKIVSFFLAWLTMLREGAVPQSVARCRVHHIIASCRSVVIAADGKVYDSNCGCGQREFAAMWIEGKPLDGKITPKLFMPAPDLLPADHPQYITPYPGSGSLAAVGGYRHQWKMLMRAAIDECKRSGVPVRKFMRALRAENVKGITHAS